MDGTIDMIATDHAPHSAEEKRKRVCLGPEWDHRSGDGFGTGITNLVKRGYLSMMDLLAKMTVNPAKLYSLTAEIFLWAGRPTW